MQLKNNLSKDKTQTSSENKTMYLKDGRKIIMKVDTKDIVKDSATYFSLYTGANAYFFDNPQYRMHNNMLVKCDKKLYVMSIPQFILNLIFWKANVVFKINITANEMYDYSNTNSNTFNDIMEHVTKMLVDYHERVTKEIAYCIADIKDKLSTFSQNCSSISCNTMSIWDVLQFRNRNKEFKELFDMSLTDDQTIEDIEKTTKAAEKKMVKLIKEDKDNCFRNYVLAGRLKIPQLAKMLCAVGTRPDIDKTIIPRPIKKSYIRGLQDTAEYYMETITARDAMMTKNDNLPRSGFLSRKINRLTSNIDIKYSVKDCGSDRYLNYHVENDDYLDMIDGKYYLDEKTNKLKIVDYVNDKHLIGETLKIRTLITCRCKDGICETCVGKTSVRLRETRIGALPAIKCINPMSQKALSAKHDLGTKSIAITNETLKKYFTNDGMDFFIKPEYASSRNLQLIIRSDSIEDIVYTNVDTSDDEVNTVIALDYIAIRDHGQEFPIENEGMRIALSDEILSNKRIFSEDDENSENMIIQISKIENTEDPIFYAILDTEEISKYLNTLIKLIDTSAVNKCTTYDDLLVELVKVIYDSGFVDNIIHFECIVKSMLRSDSCKSLPPDWSVNGNVNYKILKISDAIMNKDLYTAIEYQNLRNLFKTASICKRLGTSLYDPFFRVSKDY